LHILVDAVKQLPSEAPIRVHFLGPYWDDSAYGKSLTDRISGDPRFVQPRMIENSELLGVLAEMDVVVIPSLWLETGPLTLFDALAARVPVIGSRLGGLAELIVEGSNGWLFEAGHSAELSMRLRNILSNPSELLNLRQSAAPLRTMRNVTADYLPVYEALARN